jgi:hypothetical protein
LGESELPRIGLPPSAPSAEVESPPPASERPAGDGSSLGDRYGQSNVQQPGLGQAQLPQPPTEAMPEGSSPLPGEGTGTTTGAADGSATERPATPGPPPGYRQSTESAPPVTFPARPERSTTGPAQATPGDRYATPFLRELDADPDSAQLVVETSTAAGSDPASGPGTGGLPPPPDVSADRPTAQETAPSPTTPKPWLPLTVTVLGLFASMGGNLYLGWVAWDSRRHYRQLLRQSAA